MTSDFDSCMEVRDDRDDPDGSIARAVAWSEAIEDSEKQRDAMVKLGVKYLDHDPDVARPWLEAHGIADEVRAETSRRRRLIRQLSPAESPGGFPSTAGDR